MGSSVGGFYFLNIAATGDIGFSRKTDRRRGVNLERQHETKANGRRHPHMEARPF
jgi:hypothetical protein